MDCDVAIVGYGPIGAALAALLAGSGLRIVVVERELAPYDKPRAITGDHEMLRILQRIGVAEPLARNIRAHPGTTFIGADRAPIMSIDMGPPPHPLGWPTGFHYVQPELEAMLRDAVARRGGVEVLLGRDLVDLDERAGAALLRIEGPEGRRELRARWVVACDGATSFVRKLLGVGSEDLAFDEWWIVVDAWLRAPVDLPERSVQYCIPARPGSLVPGPGDLRRWEIKLLPHEDPERYRDPQAVREVLAGFVDVDAIEVWRSAVYRFHALVARDWRVGPVFLAGDAAHQMPPFLGQGLCAGMRDAANLAWKLLMVEQGGADPALLDSYEAERKPHVRRVVELAKERGLIIGELDPEAAKLRDARIRAGVASGDVQTVRHAYIPGLAGGLIDRAADAVAAGEVFPQPWIGTAEGPRRLEDLTAPVFLVVAGKAAALAAIDPASRDRLARLGGQALLIGDGEGALRETEGVFRNWAGARGAALTLVRPDRYAYGAAHDAKGLARLLEQAEAAVFGERAAQGR